MLLYYLCEHDVKYKMLNIKLVFTSFWSSHIESHIYIMEF